MSLREFFAIRRSRPIDSVGLLKVERPAPWPPPPPAQHPRTEIKRGDYEFCLILKTLEAFVAKLSDVQASLDALGVKIDAAVVKLGEPPAATAADLDALKSGIDGMAAKLDSAMPPTV